LTHFANLEVTHPERISVGESSLFSHREPIFHAITLSVDDNCFGMVKKAIKQSCCQHFILECIVIPPSFIVLLVEDMLEVWSDPRLRDSPSTFIRLLGS